MILGTTNMFVIFHTYIINLLFFLRSYLNLSRNFTKVTKFHKGKNSEEKTFNSSHTMPLHISKDRKILQYIYSSFSINFFTKSHTKLQYGRQIHFSVSIFENTLIFNICEYTKRFWIMHKSQFQNKETKEISQKIYVVVNVKFLNITKLFMLSPLTPIFKILQQQ